MALSHFSAALLFSIFASAKRTYVAKAFRVSAFRTVDLALSGISLAHS